MFEYSNEFKLKVLNYQQEHHLSDPETHPKQDKHRDVCKKKEIKVKLKRSDPSIFSCYNEMI